AATLRARNPDSEARTDGSRVKPGMTASVGLATCLDYIGHPPPLPRRGDALRPLPRLRRHPCLRVVSREIGELFCRCLVGKAPEACLVVAVDEGAQEGVALSVGGKFVLAGVAAGRLATDRLGEAAVEALDHPVGLGMVGAGEAMGDAM